ncbi:mediator of RNA polymerase II transcription subunit 12-like protein [Lingula anatina]|uniref:Mediator of RNA polymerase II transcription subunit 12-like protein n=1 Tax=Lingula anatina TaxID=7574 RepID=A0A1S3JEQ2_LINAN|nr:mediator of RNA polymerase II transcription subunit 12-like protein [Lingula anatina]|eukprot:XP_013408892.1 mediator of RNA polymerase II transcription subunit 12-like protein [Lingula anatina]
MAEAAQEEQKMDVDTDTFDPDYDIFAFRDDPKSPDMNVDHSTQMLWELQEHLGKISPVGGAIASVKSDKEFQHTPAPPSVQQSEPQPPRKLSRHMQYATHFPIPQDDSCYHECNQRMIVLYGVGKARDEARHVCKKVSKEIMKLFSKKNSIDISSGDIGKTKKKKEKGEKDVGDPNYEGTFTRFQKLSYYDQHAVTSSCATQVLEQFSSFSSGNSTYLPLVENISFLFDLMEHCHNINSLIEFCIQPLKEFNNQEVQNMLKSGSPVLGSYITSMCLCIVAVLRKYHACLLVMPDLTSLAFEGLCGVVKHVNNPSDCSSAERCILAYLYDLYTSCSYLKAKYSEFFSGACSKVKQTLYAAIVPSASNFRWDPQFMTDVIENAKSRPDIQAIKQLNESSQNRYSFVCNAQINICNAQGAERLNEVSILCAELTACCNSLSSEWLGILRALCCSSNHCCGYIDVLALLDVSDLSLHDLLAVFTSVLIARHCFSMEDFVKHVALPSLLAACPSAGGDQDAEPGARLTCHLLLRLFKSDSDNNTPFPSSKSSSYIKASCDRHLLSAAHNGITVGPMLAVLKAMLVLGN